MSKIKLIGFTALLLLLMLAYFGLKIWLSLLMITMGPIVILGSIALLMYKLKG